MSRTSLLPAEVLARVANVSRDAPRVDRAAIGAAIDQHLRRLRLPRLDVRVAKNAEEGYLLAQHRVELVAWARAATQSRHKAAPGGPEPAVATRMRDRLAEAAWHPAETVVRRTAEGQAWTRLANGVPPSAPVSWTAPRTAAGALRRVAAWAIAAHAAHRRGTRTVIRDGLRVWAPLLDAFEAGLWLFWVLEDEVVVVTRPHLRVEAGRLHAPDGPAVYWPPGSGYYFLSGIHVPYAVVMKPASLTGSRILEERNTEVRRVMLERYGGYERLVRDLEAVPFDADRFGTLYRIRVRGAEPLVLVRVMNATLDPDGRRREYVLRVPPDVQTGREAVAWTFGMTGEEYDPSVES